MSLTIGQAPFGSEPAGTWNFEPPRPVEYIEPLGRRVRAVKAGQAVIDSEDVRLVHVSGALPRYLFPAKDVHVPAEPYGGLDGYVLVPWDAVDAWFEEDERMHVHPRDPYHRIETFRTSRRVEVRLEGEALAASTRVRMLFESGLPVRYYFPRADVRLELLTPSRTVTECAYKGTAVHWSAHVQGHSVEDVAWSYDDEVHREGEPVRRLIAFYNERVDITVDGVSQGRPNTKWSR
jgi:uncharacterized protein (DUF427 family)